MQLHQERVGILCATVTWCVFVAVLFSTLAYWEFGEPHAYASNSLTIMFAGAPLYVLAFVCFLVLILFACRFRYHILVISPAIVWLCASLVAINLNSVV